MHDPLFRGGIKGGEGVGVKNGLLPPNIFLEPNRTEEP